MQGEDVNTKSIDCIRAMEIINLQRAAKAAKDYIFMMREPTDNNTQPQKSNIETIYAMK